MKTILYLIMALIVATAAIAAEVTVNDYDPKPAEAGKYLTVWFKVENPSEDVIRNAELEIIPKDGLELSPGEDSIKRVGFLPAESSQNIQFRFLVNSDAIEGANMVEAKLYEGESVREVDLEIQVTEKDLLNVNMQVGDIESDPTRIKPDDEDVKLVVTFLNLGDGKAQGTKAELINLPEGVILSESYSGTELIGNVEADGTAIATFYIDVDETVKPEEYEAGVKLTYKFKLDEDEDEYLFEEETLPVKLAIRSVPLYEITQVEISPGELTAGDEDVKIRLTVKNIGEKEGESVRIKVYGKTEQPFDWNTMSDFISPKLMPGEEGQATFETDIDDDAKLQRYYLDLEIKNVVGNDVLTYQKTIPITIKYAKPDNPWSVTRIGVALIALFLIVMIVRWIVGRRKKAKPKKVVGKRSSYLDEMSNDNNK